MPNIYIAFTLSEYRIKMDKILLGDIIKVRYTGWKRATNEVFDSNDAPGAPPMDMLVGSKEYIKGFTNALIGMRPGESKTVDIPIDQAYGPRNPNLMMAVPKNQLFSGGIVPKVGKILMLRNPLGGLMPGLITEIKEMQVVVDMNPPMAGQDLRFRIRIEELVKKGPNHQYD